SIKNVISRVTGGEKSEIDGTLRSNVGKADFYFINPKGVVFGQNAKVDVPAAFHVSTTDELKFKDGSSFKTSKSEQSTLTEATPESFGFLERQSATIEVNGKVIQNGGSIEINASNLEFKPESKISLTSSKDIKIQGNEEKFATLENVEGEIKFTANGSFVMDKAIIGVGGNGGGNLSLKTNKATLKKSAIIVDNIGSKDNDKGVDIEVKNEFELSEGSSISSSTWLDGDAGYVKINAGNIKIDGSGMGDNEYTGIWSDAYSTSNGNAGNIEITTSGLVELLNNGQISSCTSSKGDAGKIKIKANEIRIYDDGENDRYTGIWSDAYSSSIGNAGEVEIEASNLLSMINDSRISSDTYSKGDSGIVSIKVSGLVELLNGSQISSTTFEDGDAGFVSIKAQNLKIDGYGSGIWSLSDNDYIGDGDLDIYEGKSGEIDIDVDGLMEILDGGQILGVTFSKANGGNIKISAENLRIDGQGNNKQFTGIISDTYSDFAGKAGNIDIKVDGLIELLDGGYLSTTTISNGDAGNIKINAKNIVVDDKSNEQVTGIFSNSLYVESKGYAGEGDAGTINIEAKETIQLLNNAWFSSNTTAKGNAGYILLNTNNLIMSDSSSIESAAFEGTSGYVGDIKINANSIKIFDESTIHIMALNTLSEDKLNNKPLTSINISSKNFVADNSYIASVSEQNVPASPINIESEKFIISNGSKISSAANMADGGDISINGENIFLYNGLIITSVFEENGNGGDITINGIDEEDSKAEFLIMKGGFIKANTEGKDASGGEISINVNNIITDQNQNFKLGGNEIIVFEPDMNMNVIQAAAPNGNKGEINISGVTLDIGSSMANIPNKFSNEIDLATDPCKTIATSHASSLIYKSREGFAEMPSNLSSIFYGGNRLDKLIIYQETNQQY
ncbi:MAG: filamentous hemagglutinin N-terminal domain-containing protein, partial [Desulfamplus sp.]|nr:filamentous hemagglutinin N-terminal domain-containing protein [Desulfamplus sp.]